MLSKSLISILALTSMVTASPALRRQVGQSTDQCQDAYKSCVAAGTPEVACSCTLTACVGEDNARNREYCASATATLKPATTAAPSASASSSAASNCKAKDNACRTARVNGLSANQAQCSADNAACQGECYAKYNTCRTTRVNGLSANQAQCTSEYADCLGENPVAESGGLISSFLPFSATASSSATSTASASATSSAASNCKAKTDACRTARVDGHSANQAQCSAENAACQGDCYAKYNTCRTTRVNGLSANMAQCASEYASCLGENPIASTGGLISSFLPYSATASSSAAAQTPATTLTTTTAAAPKASGTNAAAPGSNPKKVDGKTWTLNKVIRYCGEGNTGCDYNFDIVANGNTQHCTVIRSPGSNAATESWSNQQCGDYKVSWGYVENPAPAYAVLTVVDKAGQLAWFGASNINGQAVTPSNPFGSGNYGNLGPEQVYTYN